MSLMAEYEEIGIIANEIRKDFDIGKQHPVTCRHCGCQISMNYLEKHRECCPEKKVSHATMRQILDALLVMIR